MFMDPIYLLLNFHVLKRKSRDQSEHEELDVYVAGARVGPQGLLTREGYVQESQTAVQVACKKNLLWILARRANQENQAIPSWTGFNIRTRDQVSISEDVDEIGMGTVCGVGGGQPGSSYHDQSIRE